MNAPRISAQQKSVYDAKIQALAGARPLYNLQRLDVPPPDSRPFVFVSAPYPPYPAPGAPAIPLLTYIVPVGFNAVVNFMAIFHIGGNSIPINGSGNVIWRVMVNGAGWKGMNSLLSQFGADANPLPTYIHLVENDTFQITVEVPLNQPALPQGDTTGARVHGFAYAIGKS